MIDKITRAMTIATIACWECGDRGYNFSVELLNAGTEKIKITIDNGTNFVIYRTIYIDAIDFDAIIDQMVIDIAEKTKELV